MSVAEMSSPPVTEPKTRWSVEVDRVSPSQWDRDIDQFSDATIYQTRAYGSVSWGERQLSYLRLMRDGNVVGAVQVRIASIPVLGRGVAYVRYGPLWRLKGQEPDLEVLEALTKALRDEYVGRRKLLLRILPNVFRQDAIATEITSIWERAGLLQSEKMSTYRTIRVDIRPSLEVIRKKFDGKWRNQLNRAEKNGLTIREGTGAEEYAVFQKLYDEMYARKGFETTVSTREFERIQTELPESQKMLTLLAYKDATPVSALISSGIGDTGIYLLGATSNEGMQHKGSYLLQWRMIERLKARGCSFYDLGGINPEGNPGVYHFKSGFSGDDVNFIPQFELSGSPISSFVVQTGERIREFRRQMRKKEKAADEAAEKPASTTPPAAESSTPSQS